ncbi:C4-dicarboxylate transporter/malic acid transport protein [Akanthomyces lecanii RCEF 1005]|uniref:C4-dicarboxylate transporter/malic acid transport protein n=1 Tax=Akanthomyces lecanii RCEF 1005 TaxID=1081108 RepID=A0A168GI20_CORDF|nr:C4-dicarboxylate transporter/malic acid transport protein [Akanthomyces lecanii RCEF 1005]
MTKDGAHLSPVASPNAVSSRHDASTRSHDAFDHDVEAAAGTASEDHAGTELSALDGTSSGSTQRRANSSCNAHKNSPPLGLYHRSLRVTWQWFSVNMSTGAMASLLGQIPFGFHGLRTIGEIFYVVNLVTFCAFLALMGARFARKPRALPTSLHHPSESFFFGGFWVAVALLLNGAQTYGVPRCGPWLVAAVRVLFWLYYACATCVAVAQYHIIFHAETLTLADAMPAWVLPTYPFLVTGVVAANVAKTQTGTSAVQIIVGGLAAQGLGWTIALFIYTVYLTRLISSKMPPPSMRPGLYISVGPAAYTCAGILLLGQQARKHIPDDYLGITAFPVGELWYAVSVPVGIFLWLLCMWFSSVATLSIIRDARRMHFSLSWWAFVFPNAGMAIATIQVGTVLESKPVQIAACVVSVMLVPLWLMCAVLHIRAVYRRDLLAPGKDVGVDDVNQAHDVKQRRADARRQLRRETRRSNSARMSFGSGNSGGNRLKMRQNGLRSVAPARVDEQVTNEKQD